MQRKWRLWEKKEVVWAKKEGIWAKIEPWGLDLGKKEGVWAKMASLRQGPARRAEASARRPASQGSRGGRGYTG